MPRSDALLALWGETNVKGDDLEGNARLADLSRTVAQACGARVLFHMSSAAVYGVGQDLQETDTVAPATPYGHSKLLMCLTSAPMGQS